MITIERISKRVMIFKFLFIVPTIFGTELSRIGF